MPSQPLAHALAWQAAPAPAERRAVRHMRKMASPLVRQQQHTRRWSRRPNNRQDVHGARQPTGHAQVGATMLIGHHWAHRLRVHRSARGGEDLGSIPVARRHSRRRTILSTARRDMGEVACLEITERRIEPSKVARTHVVEEVGLRHAATSVPG